MHKEVLNAKKLINKPAIISMCVDLGHVEGKEKEREKIGKGNDELNFFFGLDMEMRRK